jgi:RNA polymerase sigma factor (sigma-70 family)
MSPEEASHHLQNFTSTRCERAFRKLTEGHAGLVYSTALRVVDGDAATAQDVVQMVFTSLARRPQAVRDGKALAAWLHRVAVGCAVDAVRGESRRRKREQLSMHMTPSATSATEPDDLWQQAAPVIDAALDRLPEKDRQLLVLRFWQRQNLQAIGAGFGMSDNAVQKRLSRALEKLRGILSRRGIRGSSAALSAALLSAAMSSPSSAAIVGISTSSLALAGTSAAGSSTPILTKILAMSAKQKIALTSAAAIVAIAAPAYIQRQQVNKLQAELDALRSSSSSSSPKEVRRLQGEFAGLTKAKGQNPTSNGVALNQPVSVRRSGKTRTSPEMSTSFVPAGAAPGSGTVLAGSLDESSVDVAVLGFGGAAPADSEHRPLAANGKVKWDHSQATGAPDTEMAGDIVTAWAPKETKSGEQWLQLGYKNAVELKEVNIHETNAAGAVSKVAALMPDGTEKILWQGTEGPAGQEIIESSIPVPPGTTSRQIKVYVDTNRVESWPEIDAVEMVGTDGSKQWASESSASSSYSDNYNSLAGAGAASVSLNTSGAPARGTAKP